MHLQQKNYDSLSWGYLLKWRSEKLQDNFFRVPRSRFSQKAQI